MRPKALLQAWIDAAAITDGYLFRRLGAGAGVTASPMPDSAVARLVQARAAAVGTAAAQSGASMFKMREVSRHRSMPVLADYVCDAELFRDSAGKGFL